MWFRGGPNFAIIFGDDVITTSFVITGLFKLAYFIEHNKLAALQLLSLQDVWIKFYRGSGTPHPVLLIQWMDGLAVLYSSVGEGAGGPREFS